MENIIINIDSRFRDKNRFPKCGSFLTTLSEKIKNCMYIRLSSIEFPNLYFTFTELKKNTSFNIILDTKNIVNISISDGFYDSTSLLDTLQKKFNKINSDEIQNFEISLELTTGFVTITNNKSFNIDFSNLPSRYDSLGYQLGYRKTTYASNAGNNSDPDTNFYIKSESQLNTIGDNYIFLKINDYGVLYHDFEEIKKEDSSGNIINLGKYQGDKNMLAKIILYQNKSNQIFDNGSNFLTKKYNFRQPVDITNLNIELYDPLGNVLDLLYFDYSITLEIGVINDSKIYNNLLITNEPLNKASLNLNSGNPIDGTSISLNNKNYNYDTITDDFFNSPFQDKTGFKSLQNKIEHYFEEETLEKVINKDTLVEKKKEKEKEKKKFTFTYK